MSESMLRASQLTKRFGDLTAVDHLDLEVQRGEVFGLLGPNGAGKTTAISMLCGILRPDEGTVTIAGQAITRADSRTRSRLGFCPQETVLWNNLRCDEQLVFVGLMYGAPRRAAAARAAQLLQELGLEEKAGSLARTLSGGMRRRMNLALALIHDPDVVILDEPETGLDPQSRVLVREHIRALANRKTVILTTHDMAEADLLADRVAIIDRGRLLDLDTPSRLKQRLGGPGLLEIGIDRAPEATELAALRSSLESTEPGTDIQIIGQTLRIVAVSPIQALPGVIAALDAAGLTAGSVRTTEPSLEDVFIRLTGRELRE